MGAPIRFIHASDFHLEQPFHGVGDVPDHLRDVFLDAGYTAAERVFDAALEHDVDFLLVAGDLIAPARTGPRGYDFLWTQFHRLAEQQIGVYWSYGAAEAASTSPIAFPENVRLFTDPTIDTWVHERGGKPVAAIQGRAAHEDGTFRFGEFEADGVLPTIATVYGKPQGGRPTASDITYWALGGRHQREMLGESPHVAYPGSPQGRSPRETGVHGCRLVSVDAQGPTDSQDLTCDVVRWCQETFALPDDINEAGLLRWIRERAHHLLESSAGRSIIVHWDIVDADESTDTRSDQLMARLREGELAAELLEALRHEFGTTQPGVWHAAINVAPPARHPAGWYEEDTVLGDLLRTVQKYSGDPLLTLPTDSIPDDATIEESVASLLRSGLRDEREMVLRRIAALGVDLLRGDRVLSEEVPKP